MDHLITKKNERNCQTKDKKKHSDKLNEMYVSVNGQNDQN